MSDAKKWGNATLRVEVRGEKVCVPLTNGDTYNRIPVYDLDPVCLTFDPEPPRPTEGWTEDVRPVGHDRQFRWSLDQPGADTLWFIGTARTEAEARADLEACRVTWDARLDGEVEA